MKRLKIVKNIFIYAVFLFLFLLILYIGFYAVRLIKLGYLKNYKSEEIPELTQQQKVDEIRYLFEFINDSYPYLEIIHSVKGLGDVRAVEESFIERVYKSKNNKEYLKIIQEYFMILKQGTGHAYLVKYNKKPTNNFSNAHWYFGLKHNITARSNYYQYYWTKLRDELNSEKWFHSDLSIVYEKGDYIFSEEYYSGQYKIPIGSKILKIDNQPIDSFIFNHWQDYLLRYDSDLKKAYSCIPDPLVTNDDTTKKVWEVEILTPQKDLHELQLLKNKGFRGYSKPRLLDNNIKCVLLQDTVGYVKVQQCRNFPSHIRDYMIVKSFIDDANGNLKKLIFDFRGNSGGAPKYWRKIFLEPFIKGEEEIVLYGAIKKIGWNKIRNDFYMSRPFTAIDINVGKTKEVLLGNMPIDISQYSFLNNDDWIFHEKKIKFSPKKKINFDGEIYFIIDNDCFSATDNLARAVKQLDYAKLVGAKTWGGGMVYTEPWYFELPYSHMIFNLEIQLIFNMDGSIGTINGVEPDIRIDNFTKYPTPCPSNYEKDNLIEDEWIKHIMNLKNASR